MKPFIKEFLQDFAEAYEYSFYPDYSGRGMFGQTCIGFVTDSDNPAKLMSKLFFFALDVLDKGEFEDFREVFEDISVSSDSMGRGTIVYFPGLE